MAPNYTVKNKSLNVSATFKRRPYFPIVIHKEFPLKSMKGFYIKINGKLWYLMKEEIIIITLLVASL